LAGTYNRNTYNSALYNAGREDAGALIRSIISAHTGPHIQAVLGSTPTPASDQTQSGISFISDFTIIEGIVRKPPIAYNFPDLRAVMRAVQTGTEDLALFIRAQEAFDLPACVFPVAFLPELQAVIFGLFSSDLPASITGVLAQLDLGARLQITQKDLGGIILGIAAPDLAATVFSQHGTNLGAIIWAPHDLPGLIQSVQKFDVPADIFAFQYRDMPGTMLGLAAPKLFAYVTGFSAAQLNIPATLSSRMEDFLTATITGDPLDESDLSAFLSSSKDLIDLPVSLLGLVPADLKATIGLEIEVEADLPATITFLSSKTLAATTSAWLLGEHDRFLAATLEPFHPSNLLASISSNSNLHNLPATIESLRDTADLSAFLRASETFVTAILTISTLNASDIRATIGSPTCAGGSANLTLSATATAQHVGDLGANILSFIDADLGATINQKEIFYTMDSILVRFTPMLPQLPTFLTTDTISVVFSPFRGLNLGAAISAGAPNVDLPARIKALRRLPRVSPARNSITAAELRGGRELDIQEIRIQLEGQLLDYFYVNGTQDAFIGDSTENWKINVRSFREITSGLFGDFAAGRVSRLGNLTSFATLDEAVRNCIASVIGLQGEFDMSAIITGSGGTVSLPAEVSAVRDFFDMNALANRVFPVDLSATITGDP